ncbi:MAG: histidine--tRNA ligase [Nitrososphaerota archaeon]|nr:histidine--tRNA ligase [Nitrososphaerota archaeon]
MPRGIRDIEPDEYDLHARVQDSFLETASLFNFRIMEPATIEHLSVLRAKSGADVDKEIYAFKDKGGRDVGLRFDLTVGMTRYVCSRRGLKLPAKLGCVGGVWRYDEPQHARYRFHTQWDAEVYGPPTIDADAEVIDLGRSVFRTLGLENAMVEVGDRRVVQEFITRVLRVEQEERMVEMMRALDKVQKKTRAELLREYSEKGFAKDDLEKLFDFGRLKGPPEKVLARLDEFKLAASRDLAELKDMLADRGVKNFEYNLSIVRGIDYYTAVVFEVVDAGHPDLGSLCGGGRYDFLPRAFGRPDLSATGCAGGVEREALSITNGGRTARPLAFVAYAGRDVYGNALKSLSGLRSEGIRAEASLQERSLGKQLEDASGMGARWTIIVGRDEVSKGVVTLRDMRDRSEKRLPFDDAVAAIKSGQ